MDQNNNNYRHNSKRNRSSGNNFHHHNNHNEDRKDEYQQSQADSRQRQQQRHRYDEDGGEQRTLHQLNHVHQKPTTYQQQPEEEAHGRRQRLDHNHGTTSQQQRQRHPYLHQQQHSQEHRNQRQQRSNEPQQRRQYEEEDRRYYHSSRYKQQQQTQPMNDSTTTDLGTVHGCDRDDEKQHRIRTSNRPYSNNNTTTRNNKPEVSTVGIGDDDDGVNNMVMTPREDPFPNSLKCRRNPDNYVNRITTNSSCFDNKNENNSDDTTTSTTVYLYPILEWYELRSPIPRELEQKLVPHLLLYGKQERGMFKDQKPNRIKQLKQVCYNTTTTAVTTMTTTSSTSTTNDIGNGASHLHQKKRNSKVESLFRRDHQMNNNNNTNVVRMDLYQALSLRRHHMKQCNLYCTMSQLRLGKEEDILQSAQLLEDTIYQHILQQEQSNTIRMGEEGGDEDETTNGSTNINTTNDIKNEHHPRNGGGGRIRVYTEQEQKEHIRLHKLPNEPYPPTPDFILVEPVLLRVYQYHHPITTPVSTTKQDEDEDEDENEYNKRKILLQEKVISWIEVKMFYGASTIPNDNRSAVGCLLTTARKYVAAHGPGAMIFLYGFGNELAQQLLEIGVIALDCHYTSESTKTNNNNNNRDTKNDWINFDAVRAHQQTWCANNNGEILP